MSNQTYLTSFDGFPLSYAYFPVEDPKALVLLVHGSLEYKERYNQLIQILTIAGYACIISDNRGHGHSVNQLYPYGHMESPRETIEDIRMLAEFIRAKHPGKKLAVLAHSMGSLFVMNFLKTYDHLIDMLIMTGTGYPVFGTSILVGLCQLVLPLTGGTRGFSRLIALFNPINTKPRKWLLYNRRFDFPSGREHFIHIRFDNGANVTTYRLVQGLKQTKHYQVKQPDLPIYSLTGVDDPISGGLKKLLTTKKLFERIGYRNYTITQYPTMKHNILIRRNKELVYLDIISILKQLHIP